MSMSETDNLPSADASWSPGTAKPLVIATLLREYGVTGVQTHVQEFLAFLKGTDVDVTLLTPFSWARPLTYPVFGLRFALAPVSHSANVMWYRRGHEVFLRQALRGRLSKLGECVIYAQGPVEARAALRARKGGHQRVVMAVHYKTSQADEWCNTATFPLKRGGLVYRGIRRAESKTILQLDGLIYVAAWAKEAVESWLPEAARVPSAVIGNFTAPLEPEVPPEPLADLVSTGSLALVKNHTFLLDVLAEAKGRGRVLTLDVYGEGPLRGKLEAKTRALGLESQVRWRGFRRDVRQFLPGYRTYVHAAYSEVAPLAIIEALAAGLPVVAGRIGGIPEIIEEGVEGRFWPLDDPARAVDELLGLLDDESARQGAAEAAKKRFYGEFDTSVVVSRLMAFLAGQPPLSV